MTLPISKEDLINAKLDADDIAQFVNGTEEEVVQPRVGATYPTARNVVKNVASNVLDALNISQGVYASTAAGLAATTDTQYFNVISAELLEFVVFYQNVAGVAVEKKRYPSYEFVLAVYRLATNAFLRTNPSLLSAEFGWVVSDKFLTPILGVKNSGVAHAVLDVLPGTQLLSGEFKWVVVDKDLVVLLGIRWDGTVLVYGAVDNSNYRAYTIGEQRARDLWFSDDSGSYQLTSFGDSWSPQVADGVVGYLKRNGPNVEKALAPIPTFGDIAPYVGQMIHTPGSGQSLSVGSYATLLTTKPPVANRLLTIAVGVRQTSSLQNVEMTFDKVLPLKPLVGEWQETPLTQLCAGLCIDRLLPKDAALIGSVHGVGGYSIQSLSKGTIPYNNLITAVSQCKLDADTKSLPYWVPFVHWMQGESNASNAAGMYLARLLQLQSDLTSDMSTYNGSRNVPILLDQVSSWTKYNLAISFVPLEQLQAAIDHPTQVYCAGPKYWVEYVVDGVHLTGESSIRIAAMHIEPAGAIIDGSPWLPTHCTKAHRNGTTVTMSFHTPHPPLVIDTKLVSDPGNYGLRWIDDTNSAQITGVALGLDNTLVVTLNTVPTGANPKIGIADIGTSGDSAGPTTGARSCLRDSMEYLDILGSPVYNWTCHQRVTVG